MKTILFAVALTFCATTAHATSEPSVSVQDDGFAAQVRQIERDLSDGKTYAEMNRAERDEVRGILSRMEARLEGVSNVDELSEPDRVALFNDQERVNGMLVAGYRDSRVVCEQIRRTGTHRRQAACQTVAERRRRLETDQEMMRKMQRAPMPMGQ